MKIKKIIPAIISVILFLFLLLVIYSIVETYNFTQFHMHAPGHYDEDFHENKQAFEDLVVTVSDFYEDAKAERSDIKWVSVSQGVNDQWSVVYVTPDHENYTIYKEQSSQDRENYKIIRRSLSEISEGYQYMMFSIIVTSDRVVFSTGREYSIIYMKNGKAPKYELRKDAEMEHFYVDRLSYKWFQCVSEYKN